MPGLADAQYRARIRQLPRKLGNNALPTSPPASAASASAPCSSGRLGPSTARQAGALVNALPWKTCSRKTGSTKARRIRLPDSYENAALVPHPHSHRDECAVAHVHAIEAVVAILRSFEIEAVENVAAGEVQRQGVIEIEEHAG